MPRYTYEARDKQGRQIAGAVEASSRMQAALQLRASDLWITKLEQDRILVVEVDQPAAPRAAAGQWSYSLWPVKAGPLRDFFDQLGELLEAGVSIYDAMTVLPDRVTRRLRPILREISPPLAQGQSFADQLARYPYLFSGSTVGLMRAGELSGQLGQMCRLLADQYRQDHRVWLSLLPVRLYGWIVIFFAIMVPALPTVLRAVYEQTQPNAGPLDQLVLLWRNYAPLLVHKLLPVFFGVVALDWVLRWLLRQPWAAGLRTDFFSFVPGAAGLLRAEVNSRILTVLEAMVHAGASYDRALQAAAEAAGPGRLGRQLAQAAAQVQAGEPLGTAMSRVKALPFTARSTILTAEQAGAHETNLGRLAQAERDNLEAAPKKVAITGYLGGLALFAIVTGIAVALGFAAYYSAAFEIGEKLMP
jgi:type II secretory pathway component PulF